MRVINLPSQELLHKLLDYNPETGKLYWKPRDGKPNWAWADKEAFTAKSDRGYLRGGIGGVQYRAHRLIYKWVHNEEPPEIDHLNGIRTDNRIANLAPATRRSNMHNMTCHRADPDRHPGIRKCKAGWFMYMSINNLRVAGEVRSTIEEAKRDRDDFVARYD